jgi:hypothetical protein
MATNRTLRMIYREIPPASPCKPGCFDCCGPVPWMPAERARIEADIPLDAEWISVMGVPALRSTKTGICPFASADGCKVYERRPYMCRVFASSSVPCLQCPHGCAAKRPLGTMATDALTDRYRRETA